MLVHLDDLQAEAQKILGKLVPGDVLALAGPLAAGKTTLAKALLEAMGYKDRVTSPTFVLEKHYPVSFKEFKEVIHLDFYRLKPEELETFGWKEYMGLSHTLTIIEWPSIAQAHLPQSIKTISLELIDHETRRLTFSNNFNN